MNKTKLPPTQTLKQLIDQSGNSPEYKSLMRSVAACLELTDPIHFETIRSHALRETAKCDLDRMISLVWNDVANTPFTGTIERYAWKDVLLDRSPKCTYCNRRLARRNKYTIDHVIPLSQGGIDARSNVTIACRPCNESKGDRTIEEWIYDLKQSLTSLP